MNQMIQQIQAAYEKDIALNREAVTADDLPLSFDAVNDRWLTAVLCAGAPGAEVIGHGLGAVDDGSANRRKISVRYNEAGRATGLPTALFCKASHHLANRIVLGLAGSARGEALFYSDIRPSLDIEAPVAHFARFDPETFNSMIMLTDISDTVSEFCDHRTVTTRAMAESQMRLLGKLHGSCYSDPGLKGSLEQYPTFLEFFRNTLAFGIKEGSNAGFLEAQEVIPPNLFGRYDDIWPAAAAAVEQADTLPATLAHGDVHLKNWYVAANGEMGLGDWQCATRGHWGRDLAYTISTALSVENRREWERDLLSLYLDQLAMAGGPKVAMDVAFDIYRKQLNPTLTWWTVTLAPTPDIPEMQPREVSLEFIRRITAAMDDLDSVAA